MTGWRKEYMAYLLRLWQVRDDDQVTWRASLEDAHTGERRGFAGLDELCAFLWAKTSVESGEWKGEER